MLKDFRRWLNESNSSDLNQEEIRTLLDSGVISLEEWFELVIGEKIKFVDKWLNNNNYHYFYNSVSWPNRLYVVVMREESEHGKIFVRLALPPSGYRTPAYSEWIPLELFNRAHLDAFIRDNRLNESNLSGLNQEEIRTLIDSGVISLEEWLEWVLSVKLTPSELWSQYADTSAYHIAADDYSRLFVLVKREEDGLRVQLFNWAYANHHSEWIPLELFNRAHLDSFIRDLLNHKHNRIMKSQLKERPR